MLEGCRSRIKVGGNCFIVLRDGATVRWSPVDTMTEVIDADEPTMVLVALALRLRTPTTMPSISGTFIQRGATR
jgi:hypothetical protein